MKTKIIKANEVDIDCSHLITGKLYQHDKKDIEPWFCEIKDGKIQNHVFVDKILVKANQPIMIVERFDLKPETETETAAAMAMAVAVATATPSAPTAAPTAIPALVAADWGKAKKLWIDNKKISGYKCLTANGELVWISEIDMKYFKEVKDNGKIKKQNH